MNKSYSFFFLLLIGMHSVVAGDSQTFFQTLRTDMRAWIKGEASDEQKERLTKQAGAMILALSISFYCVVAVGAMLNGEKVPPLQVGSFKKPRGPNRRRLPLRRKPPMRTLSRKILSQPVFDVPGELEGEFNQPTPPADSVLRDDTPVRQGNNADTDRVKLRDEIKIEIPEQLFG